MGRCNITGNETNDKWNGFFICREMREMAKEMAADKGITMRKAMIRLQKTWAMAEDIDEAVSEASDGQ